MSPTIYHYYLQNYKITFMSATDALGFFLCAFGLSLAADFMAFDIDLKPTEGTPTRFFFCKYI